MPIANQTALLLLVTSVVALAGCGSMYSETRDQQGKAAREAWQKVELAAQVATPRKNHAALLAKQLELEDSLATAQRNQLARAMATGGTTGEKLAEPLARQLKQLAGGAAKTWLTALDDEAAAKRSLRKFETEFRRAGVEMPACDKIGLPATQAALQAWLDAHPGTGLRTAVPEATQACAQPAMTATQRVDLTGTDLQTTRGEVTQAEAVLADQRSKSLDARNRFRAAKAEYDTAAEALAVDPSASRDKVQAAAKKLQALAQTLGSLDDAFSVKFISEQQHQWLDKLLGAIVQTPAGQTPPAGSSDAAVALVLVPDLLDSARVALADAEKPSLVPLVLAKDLAQIRADAAARDIGARETEVVLLRQKLQRQTELVQALANARIDIDRLLKDHGPAALDISVASALAPVGESPKPDDTAARKRVEDKMRWWKAATLYLDAQGRLTAEVNKVGYQLNAIRYERAITYAESNIAQWNSLISTSVDQMAAFGASGVKAQDIVALLNSLTLLWIGKGVN